MRTAKRFRLFGIQQLCFSLTAKGALVVLLMSLFVIVTQAAPIAYTYDSLNRLTKADYGGGLVITYTYDAAGNRLTYSDVDTTPYVDTKVVVWGNNDFGETNVPANLNNVVAVAAGDDHSLALRADGTVVAWGGNYFTQTNVPFGLSNVVAVAAGSFHSLALRADGTVVAWGRNDLNGATVPVGLSNVVAIAGGGTHSLALRADGTVVAFGQIPNISTGGYIPVTVPPTLSNVVAVSAGYAHSLALRADGTVVAWGDNYFGQTNVPAGLSNVVAVAAGLFHSLALRADGTVVKWGNDYLAGEPIFLAGLSNVVAVAAGQQINLALRADGTAVLWGNTAYLPPAYTSGLVVSSNVVAVATGGTHIIALLGNCAPFVKSKLIAQTVLAGSSATFSATPSGSPPFSYQWQMNGTNIPGATVASLTLTNVLANQVGSYSVIVSNRFGISYSDSATLNTVPFVINNQPQSQRAVLSGNTSLNVQCDSILPLSYQWRLKGTNIFGATSPTLVLTNITFSQAGGYTVVVSNSAGFAISTKAALTVDSIAVWGYGQFVQTNVPAGLSNVVSVAAGDYHLLALRGDGTVVAWGYNGYGEANVPAGLNNVVAVAAGGEKSVALRSNGTVVVWGDNNYNQTIVPAGLSNVVAVAAGYEHVLALRVDGSVVAWGNNQSGESSVPSGLNNVVAIAAGRSHSLALRADGTVIGWGVYENGITGVPSGLNNVVTIVAGWLHSLAFHAEGTVVTWGADPYVNGLLLTVPAGLSNVVAASSTGYEDVALRADGTLFAWGDPYSITNAPVPTLGLSVGGIASGGGGHVAALALGPPFITSRLADRSGSVGWPVYFRVEAIGAAPLRYQWRRNGVDLPGKTNAVLQWTSFSVSDAGDYSVIVSNNLGVATIPSAKLSVNFVAVQAALDNTLPWSSATTAQGWFAQTSETHDGVDAAQSGAIGDNQFSWLDSSVAGPGTLTFWWKVSSEPDYDYLEFYLDGVLQPGAISGEVPWQKRTNSIPAGSHTLRWRYVKDISDSFGQDAGWLDEVHFTTPFITTIFSGGPTVTNGVFSMRLTGSTGANVVLERSFNLTTWTPVQTNTLSAGGLNLAVPIGTNQQQFFRARITSQ